MALRLAIGAEGARLRAIHLALEVGLPPRAREGFVWVKGVLRALRAAGTRLAGLDSSARRDI